MGVVQKNRAEEAGKYLAKIRGHGDTKLTVKPSLGNLLLWKVIYEENNFYHVDAVRLLLETEHCQGTTIKKLNTFLDFDKLSKDSQQYKDIKRFNWFSQGYLGVGEDKTIITDVRYSAVPNEVDGLWGIKIIPSKNKNDHVEWVVNRADYNTKWKKFIDLIKGKGVNLKDVFLISLLAAPEGLKNIQKKHPSLHIFTCEIDAKLDKNKDSKKIPVIDKMKYFFL